MATGTKEESRDVMTLAGEMPPCQRLAGRGEGRLAPERAKTPHDGRLSARRRSPTLAPW